MDKLKFANTVLLILIFCLIVLILGIYALRCPRLRMSSMQREIENNLVILKANQICDIEPDEEFIIEEN